MLTPEQLADLKAKAEAATPGPWSFDPVGNVLSTADGQPSYITGEGDAIRKSTDLAYIAAANPTTILQLLDMVERMEREANWLAKILSVTMGHDDMPEDWREAARKAVEASK